MKSTLLLSALVFGLLAGGCISQEQTVYRDVPRQNVEFENETAGRIFYEALSKTPRRDNQESKTDVSIPIVFEHKKRVVRSENFSFNDAISKCDTNHDGKITETEAKFFAQQH